MPVYNASCWLDECLQAILQQDFTGTMQLSVFDDASTVSAFTHAQTQMNLAEAPAYRVFSLQDDSMAVVEGWRERLEARGISLVTSGHKSAQPRGGNIHTVNKHKQVYISIRQNIWNMMIKKT